MKSSASEREKLKIMKIKTASIVSIASLLLISAYVGVANIRANDQAPNTAPVATSTFEDDEVQGELQVGKTESVILYVGAESGDYAGYCFTNDSDAGRAILAACKNKEQCHVKGSIDSQAGCKVPGLEADLSASGRIVKVTMAMKVAGKK